MSPKRAASAWLVVKRSRPLSSCLRSSSCSPGSKNGTLPLAAWAILAASVSTASTSCPNSARHAAWVRPR